MDFQSAHELILTGGAGSEPAPFLFPVAESVDCFSLAFPEALEVGFGVEKGAWLAVVWPWELGELFEGVHLFADPLVVAGVVGFEEELTVGGEGVVEGC